MNLQPAIPSERSLLIVEDDKSFLMRLARAMEGRGFAVTTAESVSEGLMQVERAAPAFAVVDMRLGDGNGLDVISALKRRRPEARGIVLTGYGNIATAVNAVKLGAVDYLAKPADADDVINALLSIEGRNLPRARAQFRYEKGALERTWQVRTEDGVFEAAFEPEGKRAEDINALVISSKFTQMFGRFAGSLLIDGERVTFTADGVVEEHHAVW